jgi:BirA family biotin operon repressor/biotin-[acetyl-CoA-carboxylase] ligase
MRIGAKVHAHQSCGSTNDLAKDLALSGVEEGTVVTARTQTRGRGTKGRSWHSPADMGLYLSVILRPLSADLSLLPLAAGLGVREGLIEASAVPVALKWPNDLIWNKRKLGGILCEARGGDGPNRFAVLGVGLNLTHEERDFPEDFRATAASLHMAGGWDGNEQRLLSRLYDGLERWYGAFRESRVRDILDAYRDAACFAPAAVLTLRRNDGGVVRGRWAGFDDRGGLVLDLPEGRAVFFSADTVSLEDAG